MARTITTEHPSRDVRRYLRHWGDPAFVEPALRKAHPALDKSRARTKARHISVLVQQGVEFLDSAETTSIVTKPLALFYATESLIKALCIYRDFALDSSVFRMHGLSGDKVKRYSIKNLECRVQKPSRDVWSNAFRLLNSDLVRLPYVTGGAAVTLDHSFGHKTKPLKPASRLQLGWLLRQLPELADDVEFAGWGHSMVVHLSSFRIMEHTTQVGQPPETSATLSLRHGRNDLVKAMILRHEGKLLRECEQVGDEHDTLEYRRPAGPGPVVLPTPRMDVFGDLFMLFYGGRKDLSETLAYFAGLFVLSDVVRYQPQQWLRLLDDHPRESILVERFLDIAIRKVPNLVLNELQGEVFLFRFAR